MPTADLTPAPVVVAPATVPPNTTIAAGTLGFSSSGALSERPVSPIGVATPAAAVTAGIALTIPPVAMAPAVQTTFADGAATMPAHLEPCRPQALPPSHRPSTASATSATSTNGFASGTLSTYAVQPDGTIEGTFSSGQTLALGQVAVASFSNSPGTCRNWQQQLPGERCLWCGRDWPGWNWRTGHRNWRLRGAVKRKYRYRVRQADRGAASVLGKCQVDYYVQSGLPGDHRNAAVSNDCLLS